MNTVKDLREALAEEMRRLQPRPGLESRVLQQALGGFDAFPSDGAPSRRAIRSRKSGRWTPLMPGVRATGAIAVVLIVLLIMVGILVGGRLFRDFGPSPAGPPTHAVPRAGAGMVSSTTGWLVDSGQSVERTTDGGAHWAYASPLSTYDPIRETSIYFLDATHAWLTSLEGSPRRLITFRTADGGKSWGRGSDLGSIGDAGAVRLYFLDATHGWLLLHIANPTSDTSNPNIGEDALYKTTDGGLHWVPLATNAHTNGAGCDWKTAAFASVSDGWLTVDCASPNDSQIWMTTHDGGKTWSPQGLPPAAADLVCPCGADPITVFDRNSAAILVRSFGRVPIETRVLMTTDGGISWAARKLPGESQLLIHSFPGAVFIDPKHGWAVGGPSALFAHGSSGLLQAVPVPLYRTDDGGLTWAPVETNLPLTAISAMSDLYFVDLQHGFIHASQFFKTDDGGHHWEAVVPTADFCPTALSSTCNISSVITRR